VADRKLALAGVAKIGSLQRKFIQYLDAESHALLADVNAVRSADQPNVPLRLEAERT
jgi:hypothetical protein